MWRLRNFLTRSLHSDRADGILVSAMILLPVLALIIGGAVEVQKNNYVRTERINAIQDAANSAVTLTDSQGSLDWRVVDRIVNEYEYQRFGGQKFSKTYDSEKRRPDDDTTANSAESRAFEGLSGEDACLGTSADLSDKYPLYRITLNNVRGNAGAVPGREGDTASKVIFARSAPTTHARNPKANLKPGVIYNSVKVEITDQTPNMVLGAVGMPCQKFTLEASAITYAADAEISR